MIKSILRNSVICNPLKNHTATIIFSHGLGDTGDGWLDVAEELGKGNDHIKFILPNAPIQAVTINGGYKMNSWYDIKSLSSRGDEDKSQVDQSKELLETIIKNEIEENKIPSERILLAGFSQGAALSLYTFYTTDYKLAGCMALSGYLPLLPKFGEIITNTNKQQPMIMFHGDADQVVKISWGKQSFDTLVKQGVKGDFVTFNGLGHSSSYEEINEMDKFIKQQLPKLNK